MLHPFSSAATEHAETLYTLAAYIYSASQI